MARIRTIKPEFWKHEALSDFPEATHILAAALLNYADDYGYFNANVGLVRAECSPLREPSVSIPESLRSLQEVRYIALGTLDGKRYGRIVAFEDHQRVSHPAKSKIADKPIVWDDSGNPPEIVAKPPEPLRPELGTGNGTGNMERGTGNAAPAALPDPIKHRVEITSKPNNDGPNLEKPPSEQLGRAPPNSLEIPAALDRRPKRGLAEHPTFAAWYDVFPRHEARGEASASYHRALDRVTPEILLDGARRYAAYVEVRGEKQFTKLPATWLNKGCWTDQYEVTNGRKSTAHDKFLAGAAAFIEGVDERGYGAAEGENPGDDASAPRDPLLPPGLH